MKNCFKLLAIIFSLVIFVTCTSPSGNDDAEELILPAAPTNLEATVVDSSQIDLSWYVVSTATGYKVHQATALDGDYSEINNVSSNLCSSTGLSANTKYYYKVTAYNADGYSEFSDIVSAITIVSTPTNLTAKAISSSRIDLSWNAVSGEANYRIYKSSSLGGAYNPIGNVNSNFYSNTGLKANTACFYKVKAYNESGESEYSNIAGDTTIVAAPSNLAAKAVSISQIFLSWDAVDGADGYTLYKDTASIEAYAQIDVGNVLFYTDTVSDPHIEYSYKLKAYRSSRSSDFSATVKSRVKLLDPEGLSLRVLNSTQIGLSWTVTCGAAGYYLYISDDGNNYSPTTIENVTSYSHKVASADTMYYYKIKAYNAVDTSEFSQIVKGRIHVTNPENLTAKSISASEIDLSWDVVSGADSYRVFMSPNFSNGTYTKIGETADTAYRSNELAANTEYFYKVIAFNKAGSSNIDYANIASDTTIVAPPAGFSDTVVSFSQIDLQWDAVDGAAGYRLYISADDGNNYCDTAIEKVTSYSDTGLTANSKYYYKILAYNGNGDSEFSDTLIITTKVLAPTGLADIVISASQINLSWNSVEGADGYTIYRSSPSSADYKHTLIGEVTSCNDTGLTAFTSYTYKVTAYSDAGESGFSDTLCDTTMVAAPANFCDSVVDSSQINLFWSSVDGASCYYVSYSIDSGRTYIDTSVGTDTFYYSTGLNANTKYFYTVRAYNYKGYSDYSDTLSLFTIVAAPTNVSAKSKSSSRIDISWDEVEGAERYRVYMDTTGNVGSNNLLVDTSSTSYCNTGLAANTEYFYKVTAYNTVGESKASSIVSDTTIVAAPSNLSDSVVSASRIDLQWDTVPGAASYKIYRLNTTSKKYDSVGVASINSYSDTALSAYTVYTYKLKAYNGNGNSEFSGILFDTTKVDAPKNLTDSVISASQIKLFWNTVAGADGYSLSYSGDGTNYSDTALGNVTTYSDTGLAANSVHYYKVLAYNGKGNGEFSSTLSDTTIVTHPSNLTDSVVSASQIDLRWNAVDGAKGYRLAFSIDSGQTYSDTTLGDVTTYSDKGLAANSVHYYKVLAYNGNGDSEFSNILSDTTMVAAPSTLTDSVISSSQIKLFWNSVAGATSYSLSYSGDGTNYSDTALGNVTTYSHTGLFANSVHFYKVQAYNTKGFGVFSSVISDTTIVTYPSNLTDSVVSASRIDLQWDTVPGAASYTIYRDTTIGGGYDSVGVASINSYSDTGLSANTAYFYKLKAHNGNGYSEFSDILSDTTKVDAPKSLTDSVISSSQIKLFWNTVDGATSYSLSYSEDGTAYSDTILGNDTSYSDTGLAANSVHYYKVLAYNGKGNGEFSSVLSDTTIVLAPRNLTDSVVSASQIDLKWSEVEGAAGYRLAFSIDSGQTYSDTTLGNVTTYSDTGLTAYTVYSYKLKAYNGNGYSIFSKTVSDTTKVAAPSNLTDSVVSKSQINLYWNSVAGATSYSLSYSEDGTAYSDTILGNVTTYSDTGLAANSVHYYKVKAYNTKGFGAFSSVISDTTIVTHPSNLTDSVVSASRIDLQWDTVPGAASYKIYRLDTTNGEYGSVGDISSNFYSDTGLSAYTVYSYKVLAYNNNGDSEFSDILSDTTIVAAPSNLTDSVVSKSQINLYWNTVAGADSYYIYRDTVINVGDNKIGATDDTIYLSTGLTANTEYFYKVLAYNTKGFGAFSSVISDTTIVLAPSNLTDSVVSASRIDLKWSEVDGAAGYVVYIDTSGDGNYTREENAEDTVFSIESLSANTVYSYKVLAYNNNGDSEISDILSDTTIVDAPSNLTDSVISASQIKLFWNTVAGASGYYVYMDTISDGAYASMKEATDTFYSDTGLFANSVHYYKVLAYNGKGDGEFSSTLCDTTIVAPPRNLTDSVVSASRIDLSWSEVEGAAGYVVYIDTIISGNYDRKETTDGTTFSIENLSANTAYFYKLKAHNGNGYSIFSDILSDTTIVDAPSNLTDSVVSKSQINLYWNTVAGADSYYIYRDTIINVGDNKIGATNETNYLSTGLTANTEYFYKVQAYNTKGFGAFSSVISDTTIVTHPSNLSDSVMSASQIDLKWDTVPGAASYKIYRLDTTSKKYDSVGVASINSYSDKGLSAYTVYSYKVLAYNNNGESKFSDTLSDTTKVDAPSNLTDSVISSSQIKLFWNTVAGATSYAIYRLDTISGDYISIGDTNSTTYYSTGLTANTEYFYKVRAYNTKGFGEFSGTLSDTTIVAAPSNLADSVVSASRIDLKWSEVEGATGYRLAFSIDSGRTYSDTTLGDVTTYSDKGLAANSVHYYKVLAYNGNGDSEFSDILSDTTIVDAPKSLTDSVISSSQIKLFWNSVDGATSYSLSYSGDGTNYSDTALGNVTTYSHTGLTANSVHYYKVLARNGKGNSAFSDILCDTTIVAAPANLVDSVVSASRIDLRWDTVPGAASYKIYRLDTTSGDYDSVGVANSNSYSDTGLSAFTVYSYKVLAYNNNGYSIFSNTVSDTTIIDAPKSLTDSVISSSQIKLFWNTVDGATSYSLSYSEDGTAYSDTILGNDTSYSDTGLAANSVHYYKVLARNGKGNSAFSDILCDTTIVLAPSNLTDSVVSASRIDLKWSEVDGAAGYRLSFSVDSGRTYSDTTLGNVTTYSDTGLTANTKYFYRVSAHNTKGYSDFSDTLRIFTIVASPTNLTDSVVSASQINLSWHAVAGATSYAIYRLDTISGDYISIGDTNSTTYYSTGLAANTEYFYKVKAYNGSGYSAFSSGISDTTIVLAPSNLESSVVSASRIDLRWDTVPGAARYKIYRLDTTNGEYGSVGDISSNSYSDTGLSAYTVYTYKLKAYNGNGYSVFSDILSDTTIVAAPADLKASAVDSSQIRISWSTAAGADGYYLYISDDGEHYGDSIVRTDTFYSSMGLNSDTEYYYKVRSYHGRGVSDFSAVVIGKINVNAPANVFAEAKSFSQIDISWDKVSGAEGYTIYHADSSGENFSPIGDIDDIIYQNKGLNANSKHFYKIQAYNAVDTSSLSDSVSVTTIVATPTILSDSAASPTQIDISWSEVAGATGYYLCTATSSEGSYDTTTVGLVSNYSITSLSENSKRFYKIAAYSDAGQSAFSSIDSATTYITLNTLKAMIADRDDVTQVNTAGITNMESLFSSDSTFNQDISGWDVSNVTIMNYMFSGAKEFNGDISGWDVSNVQTMQGMFSNAILFNSNISNWNVSKVENMLHMFSGAETFNQNLNSWEVGSVTNMSFMFFNDTMFNGDINGWDVSSVTNMSYMFDGAKAFNKDLNSWDVDSVTNMNYMFAGATKFNGNISAWNVGNVEWMSAMFMFAKAFNINLSGWKSKLTSLDEERYANYDLGAEKWWDSYKPF